MLVKRRRGNRAPLLMRQEPNFGAEFLATAGSGFSDAPYLPSLNSQDFLHPLKVFQDHRRLGKDQRPPAGAKLPCSEIHAILNALEIDGRCCGYCSYDGRESNDMCA